MAANDDLKELAEQIMKDKLVLRSKKIQEFLHEKRNLTAYQNGQKKIDLYFAHEEKEEMTKKQEVPAIKGHMDLSKHRKKYKRGKRCWICKSTKHLKRKCPKNRCFFCDKYGHIKADCFYRKINFIYSKLWEDYQEREKRKRKRFMETKEKKEQKEMEIKVFQKRANELKVQMEKTEKGDVPMLKWKDLTIGEYTGSLHINEVIRKFQLNKYNWQKINLLVERAAPYKNFTIYPGLTNWCSCGEIDLFERDFIGHLKDHHHGVVLRNSQLNRPPWLDLVKYKNDLIEEIICYSEEELDTNLLDNQITN